MNTNRRINMLGILLTITFIGLLAYWLNDIGVVHLSVGMPTALPSVRVLGQPVSSPAPKVQQLQQSELTATFQALDATIAAGRASWATTSAKIDVALATPQPSPVPNFIPVTSTPEPPGTAIVLRVNGATVTPSEAQDYFAEVMAEGTAQRKVLYTDCVLIGPIDEANACELANTVQMDCDLRWVGAVPPDGMGVVVSTTDTCTPGSLPTR